MRPMILWYSRCWRSTTAAECALFTLRLLTEGGSVGGAPSWEALANLLWVTWGFTLHNLRVHCNGYSGRDVRAGHAPTSGMRKADEIASKVKSNRVQRRFTALVEQPWPRSGCADQIPAMKSTMLFPSLRAYHMDNDCQSADGRHPLKPTSLSILGRRRPLKSTLPAGRGYRLRMEAGGWIACHTAACSTTITTVADTPCAYPEGICRDDMRRTRLQQRSNVQPRTLKVQHVAYSKQVRHTPCCPPRRLRSDFSA